MSEKKILNPITKKYIKKDGRVYKDLVNRGIIPTSGRFVEKIRNPLTGRLINKGSTLYKELINSGKISKTAKVESKVKKFEAPKHYNVPQSFKKYPVDREEVAWGIKKPSKVGERRYVKEKCGESCFLMPDKNKFPICNKTLPCTYNCRGIKAASARAGEFKYHKVLDKSKELSSAFGCYRRR